MQRLKISALSVQILPASLTDVRTHDIETKRAPPKFWQLFRFPILSSLMSSQDPEGSCSHPPEMHLLAHV